MRITTSCPLCGSEVSGYVHRGVQDLEHGLSVKTDFSACPVCALIIQTPRPSADQLASYYPADYRPHMAAYAVRKRKSLLAMLKSIQASMLIDKLSRFLPKKNARILELGCGSGNFLKGLQRRGYLDLTGVDQNPQLASIFKNTGIRFFAADIEKNLPFEGRFDVIVMSYVTEHFLDIGKIFEKCKALLEPGGQLLILTPNSASLSHLFFGKYWSGLHAPRHVYIFNPQNLAVASKSFGFQCYEYLFLSDPASWAISFQNLISVRFARSRSRSRNHVVCTDVTAFLVSVCGV